VSGVCAMAQIPTTDCEPGIRSLDLSAVSQLCGTAGTGVALPGLVCGHGLLDQSSVSESNGQGDPDATEDGEEQRESTGDDRAESDVGDRVESGVGGFVESVPNGDAVTFAGRGRAAGGVGHEDDLSTVGGGEPDAWCVDVGAAPMAVVVLVAAFTRTRPITSPDALVLSVRKARVRSVDTSDHAQEDGPRRGSPQPW